MDENFITLYELQLYVKSWGNSNNKRVKEFLNNIFKIGFTARTLGDIFPMAEFEYGDFLELDKKFLYKEYLHFLNSNENIDDVLFHIAEKDYDKFQDLCSDFAPKISDLRNLFETRKEYEKRVSSAREIIANHSFIDEKINFEDDIKSTFDNIVKKLEIEKEETDKEETDKEETEKDALKAVPEIEDKEEDTSQIAAQIDLTEYHYKESDYFFANIFDKMNIQINHDIKLNVFARMRINEYLKDMEKLRDDIETIFSK